MSQSIYVIRDDTSIYDHYVLAHFDCFNKAKKALLDADQKSASERLGREHGERIGCEANEDYEYEIIAIHKLEMNILSNDPEGDCCVFELKRKQIFDDNGNVFWKNTGYGNVGEEHEDE